MTFLLLMALTCAEPKMQNTSQEPWNDYDKSILKQAQKRCGELYNDAQCVKLFRKYRPRQYTVICGSGDKE